MRLTLLSGAVLAGVLVSPAARADTLRGALIRTYESNPTLTGARARQRSIDEGVPIARAAGRPSVNATAGFSQNYTGFPQFTQAQRSVNGGASADYAFYQGGRVRNAVRAAESRVVSGRAGLRVTEGDLFTEAVGAYMDVIRDESIVQLNENQIRVLETNLRASQDRFEVGDLTRTDVAQSEARLENARAQLATATGRLTTSRENYRRIVGAPPEFLEAPPPLPTLPVDPQAAVTVALRENQDLQVATENARAAGYDVRTIYTDRLPRIGVGTSSDYSNFLGSLNRGVGLGNFDDSQTVSRVGLQMTLPLYQGGQVAARVRQARAVESQTLEQIIETERFVIANTRAAFASLGAANETIRSSESAVAANRLALEGTRAEQSVGTRNVLDVLNAEQELLNSEVTLVTSRRDAYVAGFALLNAMGQAERQDLALDGGALYDPVVYYNSVRNKWSEADDGPAPVPQATRTVDTGTRPLPEAEPQRTIPTPRPNPLVGDPVTQN